MSSYEKPIWIFSDGYLIFETFTGFLEEIQDFLVTISFAALRAKLASSRFKLRTPASKV